MFYSSLLVLTVSIISSEASATKNSTNPFLPECNVLVNNPLKKHTNEEKLQALKMFLRRETLEAIQVAPKRMKHFKDIDEEVSMEIAALQKEFGVSHQNEITDPAKIEKYQIEERMIIDEAINSALRMLQDKQREVLREMVSEAIEIVVMQTALREFEKRST